MNFCTSASPPIAACDALVVVDVAGRRDDIFDQPGVHDHLAAEVAKLAQVGLVGREVAEQRRLQRGVLRTASASSA